MEERWQLIAQIIFHAVVRLIEAERPTGDEKTTVIPARKEVSEEQRAKTRSNGPLEPRQDHVGTQHRGSRRTAPEPGQKPLQGG